jgi:hypothetical protein
MMPFYRQILPQNVYNETENTTWHSNHDRKDLVEEKIEKKDNLRQEISEDTGKNVHMCR